VNTSVSIAAVTANAPATSNCVRPRSDRPESGTNRIAASSTISSHHLKNLSCAGVIAEREAGTRKFISLRREELDRRFPGLIDSVLRAADERG
jgi:hypothetical protein